jgi:trimethylamine--corrinoid protein Co-methyltransferase
VDAIHIVDALPELTFCMSMGIPCDVEAAKQYRHQFALMLEHTTKPIVFVCDDRADCEAIVGMASAVAGGMDKLQLNPTILLYSEPSPPLRHSQTATAKLLYAAEKCLPVVHSSSPIMGATGPVTLAGGVALANAEVLSGLVMHQLKHPGAPFIYGAGIHHMDMRTTISVHNAPEFQLTCLAVAEMGRFYGLPTWGYAGNSDSCAMDEQAAADATFSVLVALLAGHNLAHDVGYVESGLTTSPEMIVFTAEVISMMRRFMEGIPLDTESLALEAIETVGPGGNFLTDKHTLKHFREMWQPTLFNRRRLQDWVEQGSKRLGQQLNEKTLAILQSHKPEPLPDSVRDELGYILKSD